VQASLHLASGFVTIFARGELGQIYAPNPCHNQLSDKPALSRHLQEAARPNAAPVHMKSAKEPKAGTLTALCVRSSRLMSTTPAAACPLLRCLAVLSEELWHENWSLAARRAGKRGKSGTSESDY